MRINQFIAKASGISRRKADQAISSGRVTVNGHLAQLGASVEADDKVMLDSKPLSVSDTTTIMLNKPTGYVCSRDGQGSKTIYDLLPSKLSHLKPVGRLDKDSSGLLLLTNDGNLANQLTHPKYNKQKVYEIELDKNLPVLDGEAIQKGVELDDGISKLSLEGKGAKWTVTMSEGRNRQIRRTFGALGYRVTKLHRTQFGEYQIEKLLQGKYKII